MSSASTLAHHHIGPRVPISQKLKPYTARIYSAMPAPRNRRAPAKDPADYTKVADEIVTAAYQLKKKAAAPKKTPQRATIAATLIGGQLEETPLEP